MSLAATPAFVCRGKVGRHVRGCVGEACFAANVDLFADTRTKSVLRLLLLLCEDVQLAPRATAFATAVFMVLL